MNTEAHVITDERMPELTLEKIAEVCDGTYIGDAALKKEQITGAVTDSRKVEKGFLFIPMKGKRADGHDFIPQVFAQGALAVFSEKELKDAAGPYILVGSTETAMKKLAAFYRRSLDIKVVGIVGSVGKTSTKEMVASVLSEKYAVHKTAENYNNEIGLPLTVFQIKKEHQAAVLEMGISDFGEMHRLAEIAYPDICVLTNIGFCHLENLKDRDGVLKAKTECFDHMKEGGTVILNGDDDKLASCTVVNGKAPVFYGIGKREGLSIYADHIENLGFDGMRAVIHTPKGSFLAEISIPGKHNVYNALAAAAVGLEMGLTTEEIAAGIAKAHTIAGRVHILEAGGVQIIDDCYNANPVSMKASLSVLAHAKGRRIAVLGDMGELGAEERKLHHEVGEYAGSLKIATLFCSGTLAEEYKKAAEAVYPEGEVYYYPEREEMTKVLLSYVKAGDTVLVKASHFMEFTKVVKALQELEEN